MNQMYFDRLVKEIQVRKLDAILIAPSQDLRFLIGFVPMLCLRFQGLFITREGNYFYICNVLTKDEILPYIPNGQVYSWHDNDDFSEVVKQVLAEHNLEGKRIGVNHAVRAFNILEISEKADVSFVSARDLCSEIRIYKTDDEIERMKHAAGIGTEALKYFTTRLGHGLGYMPHEAPDIKANNRRKLEARMAFTIEPGIYMDDFGVRIEDCLVMDSEGQPVVMSEGFTKECMIIGGKE